MNALRRRALEQRAQAASRRALLVGSASIAVLAGCASLAPDIQAPRSAARVEPTEWSGRFSAVYTQPGAPAEEHSASGRFRLVQRDGQTLLELASPIGQTIAQAQVDGRGARLTDSGGRNYQAPSAEALTERLFGWRVPVLLLPAWLQGRLGPLGPAGAERAASGTEAGWEIRIDGWRDDQTVRTLNLTWPAPGSVADRRLRLRLVVDSAS